MKVKDLLSLLTVLDSIKIYEMRQGNFGTYVDILYEGKNGELDTKLYKEVLQREVLFLSIYGSILYICLDGDINETTRINELYV